MWRALHAQEPERPATVAGRFVADGVDRLGRGLMATAGGLLDMVLPPSCPGCRRPSGSAGGLCVACWKTLIFLEEPWCARLGTPLPYDLGPGTLSAAAVADPPVFDRARSAVAYEGVAPDLVQALKYADRTELADLIGAMTVRAGRELLADADALVPIPLHRWRLFRRRFNQAELIGRAIGRVAGVPVWSQALGRAKATRPQVGLTRDRRADNVRGAFVVPPAARSRVKDARLVLVDDVMTTGATLEAATRVLKRAGAARVDVLTFARVVVIA